MEHRLRSVTLWCGWIVILHCTCGYSTGRDSLDPAKPFNRHLDESALA